ncbi:MAG TPA: hypothetical protein VFH34_01520 [Anaerolineales bacterium]|nr:hypothetical protein [Anaerolineales bacterium]
MTAKGGVKGPVSTKAEKAFSQIGLALLFSSVDDTFGVGVMVDIGLDAAVSVEDTVSLGGFVGLVVEFGEGAA